MTEFCVKLSRIWSLEKGERKAERRKIKGWINYWDTFFKNPMTYDIMTN
jgi:hypothetical protein